MDTYLSSYICLHAIQAGYNCYITKTFIAVCPTNGVAAWCNPKTSFFKRWQLMHSPKGLNIKEYLIFKKKFEGIKWVNYAIKAYLKVLVPKYYFKISKKLR